MSDYYLHLFVAASIAGGFFLINDIVKEYIEKPWWKNILATVAIFIPLGAILGYFMPKNLDHVETSSIMLGFFLGLALSELIQFVWKRMR